MIDLKFFRDNFEKVEENCKKRRVRIDLHALKSMIEKKQILDKDIQEIQKRRNDIAKIMKGKLGKEERELMVVEGKGLKHDESLKQEEFRSLEEKVLVELAKIPNMTHPDSPVGESDEQNKELRKWGKPRKFKFKAKDHVELGEARGWIDFKNGAKVSGSKFYYLKGDIVLLELALIRFALDILIKEGFQVYTTPDLARMEILEGTGFNPRGEESQVYSILNKSAEGSDLCLIGTAEITLGGLYSDSILTLEELPILVAGVSHCFRTEAGSAGKVSKGLYRVHQFTKVEMFAFTLPEESEKMHERFVQIEEKIYQTLEIPYRVVDVCTGELGGPAYRKYDIEAWMPGRGEKGEFGEVTSTSNCTDYQARRLKIRFKRGASGNEFVHMLNGTAIALSRTLISILENFQEEDMTIKIPKALQPYLGKEKI